MRLWKAFVAAERLEVMWSPAHERLRGCIWKLPRIIESDLRHHIANLLEQEIVHGLGRDLGDPGFAALGQNRLGAL